MRYEMRRTIPLLPVGLVLAALAGACLPAAQGRAAGGACGLVPAERVGEAVGSPVESTSADRPGGAVETACAWRPAGTDSLEAPVVLVQVVSGELLRRERRYPDARTFFDVTAAGAGAAYGGEGEPVTGLGEAAVWGGAPAGGPGGELWLLQGDRVVGILATGLDRERLVALGREAASRLPT